MNAATRDEMRNRTNWGRLLPPAGQPQPPRPGLPSPADQGQTSGHRSGEVDVKIPCVCCGSAKPGRKLAVRILLAAGVADRRRPAFDPPGSRLRRPPLSRRQPDRRPAAARRGGCAGAGADPDAAAHHPGGATESPDRQRLSGNHRQCGRRQPGQAYRPRCRLSGQNPFRGRRSWCQEGRSAVHHPAGPVQGAIATGAGTVAGQQAALLYAKTEVVRYTALLKRDAATQVDVDHWNFEQASAEANIAAAQAQVAIGAT